jgi:hypothetical protein
LNTRVDHEWHDGFKGTACEAIVNAATVDVKGHSGQTADHRDEVDTKLRDEVRASYPLMASAKPDAHGWNHSRNDEQQNRVQGPGV